MMEHLTMARGQRRLGVQNNAGVVSRLFPRRLKVGQLLPLIVGSVDVVEQVEIAPGHTARTNAA
jgi:hypothetical protein